MLKIHKFNKRLKAPNKNVKEDYQKANQSSITNSSMNSSSLSRIIKTDRKMPNEKSIYTRQRIDCFFTYNAYITICGSYHYFFCD